MDTSKEVFNDDKIHALGIDVGTSDVGLIMGKLKKLKSTIDIQDGGAYWEDNSYSQIWIKTTMNEDALDEWLYKASFPREVHIEGVFEKDFDGIVVRCE